MNPGCFEYELLPDGNAEITDFDPESRFETIECLAIPDEIDGHPVTGIGSYAFQGCRVLKSVEIPCGIRKIGDTAFYGCSELISVNIPETVEEIGESAFAECEELVSVSLPNGLKTIGDSAFSDCSSLSEIVIPESVCEIGSSTFDGCAGLKSAKLPEGLKEIPYALFDGCRKLKTVNIPESVTLIGGSAFSHCSSLTALDIPDGVTGIGESAFEGDKKLVIRIPKHTHEEYCGIRDIEYVYYETDTSLDFFVLVIRLCLKDGNVIRFIGEGGVNKGDREYHQLFASCQPDMFSRCTDTEDLAQYFRRTVVQGLETFYDPGEDPGEAAVFTDDSRFIKEIRQIKSMDDIKTITINADLWSAGKHNYKHYTYYMDDGETVYDHGGPEMYGDELGGGTHITQFPSFIKGDNQGQAAVEDHKGYDADVPMPEVIKRGFW